MPSFVPPTINEVPQVDPLQGPWVWPGGPVEHRLFAHYGARARGQTFLLMSDNTVINLGTFPSQTTNPDPTSGNGDVFTEQGLGGSYYGPALLPGGTGGSPSISRVFLGGGVYPLSAAEVTALTAAGYGGNIV
jgi:hypothetical protein